MLTAGQTISLVAKNYLNISAGEFATDPAKRNRLRFNLRSVMTRVWTITALSQRHGNGAVTIDNTAGDNDDGIGEAPGDFAGFGTQSSVVGVTGGQWPMSYMEEQQMLLNAKMFPNNFGQPLFYTRVRQTAGGASQVRVYPPVASGNAVVIAINAYNRKCLEPVDFPRAPVVASATAPSGDGLTGAYKWKAVYVWADGTTEGGFESASLSLTDAFATVRVPISEARSVTGVTFYRTAAGGSVFKECLSLDADDIVWIGNQAWYQGTDDTLDTDLGPLAPMPGDEGIATGLEQFPDDFIETTLFLGTVAGAAGQAGDLRDAGFWKQFDRNVLRMWRDQKPGQAEGKRMTQFMENRNGVGYTDPRWRFPMGS